MNALCVAMLQGTDCRRCSVDTVPNCKAEMYLEPQVSVEYVLKAVMFLYLQTVYMGLDFAPLKLQLP